jgi:hypothetical protein
LAEGETELVQSRAQLALGATVIGAVAAAAGWGSAVALGSSLWLGIPALVVAAVVFLIFVYLVASLARPARVRVGADGLRVADFWQTRTWPWTVVYGVTLQQSRGGPIAVLEVAEDGALKRIGLPGGLSLRADALRDLIERTRAANAPPAN